MIFDAQKTLLFIKSKAFIADLTVQNKNTASTEPKVMWIRCNVLLVAVTMILLASEAPGYYNRSNDNFPRKVSSINEDL
jgi:hypothetical protein